MMNYFRFMSEKDWHEIKDKIQSQWEKLTHDDIEKINGSYQALLVKLQELYEYTVEDAQLEIEKFFAEHKVNSLKEKAMDKFQDIKSTVSEKLGNYLQFAKRKSARTEKAIARYTLRNPGKCAIFATVTGVFAGFLYKHRKYYRSKAC